MVTIDEKVQIASQDYDCDDPACDVPIPEDTQYVRVAEVGNIGHVDAEGMVRNTAFRVWKFHPSCWQQEEAI